VWWLIWGVVGLGALGLVVVVAVLMSAPGEQRQCDALTAKPEAMAVVM
jgi:hypothetical protein